MIDQQPAKEAIAGVDTHTDTHHAAVVDPPGRPLADREFPTTTQGYRGLLMWLITFGHVQAVGVECTGSYGAGLTTVLSAADLTVVEVNAPKAYQGAGRHVRVPFRGRPLRRWKRRHNSTHAKIRCLGEQAMAVLKGRRLPRKLRCSTNRITHIVKAVVVLHHAST